MKHYSPLTEATYVDWMRRFILFHRKLHPAKMRKMQIEKFLSHLPNAWRVYTATKNQPRCALWFLYRKVLLIELPQLDISNTSATA